MNEFYIRNVVEAALLAAGKPMQLAELGQLFDENGRPKVEDLQATLTALAAEYENRGLEVKETAAGFRIQVRKEFAAEISRLWPERPAKYSRALLETLALIAYRQPITRAEIEAVRGVAVNPNIVKTVIERNWVRVVGHRDVPGRPELLGTTREFLDYFGLRSLDELPPLADVKAIGDYNLQLELPNGAAAGADGKTEGGEGAAVALLTDGSAAPEGAIAEGAVAAVEGAAVEGAVTAEGVAGGEAAVSAQGVGSAEGAALAEGTTLADGAASVTGAVVAQVETVEVESVMAEGGDAEAQPTDSETVEAVDDTEAERTLGAHEAPHHTAKAHTAESDESEASSESNATSESLDALDDASDDDADEDELSADGHGSRELVAAPPRDGDD